MVKEISEEDLRADLADRLAYHCNFLGDITDLGIQTENTAYLSSKWMFVNTLHGTPNHQSFVYELFNKETATKTASIVLSQKFMSNGLKVIQVKYSYYRKGKLIVEKQVQSLLTVHKELILEGIVNYIPKTVLECFLKGFDYLVL